MTSNDLCEGIPDLESKNNTNHVISLKYGNEYFDIKYSALKYSELLSSMVPEPTSLVIDCSNFSTAVDPKTNIFFHMEGINPSTLRAMCEYMNGRTTDPPHFMPAEEFEEKSKSSDKLPANTFKLPPDLYDFHKHFSKNDIDFAFRLLKVGPRLNFIRKVISCTRFFKVTGLSNLCEFTMSAIFRGRPAEAIAFLLDIPKAEYLISDNQQWVRQQRHWDLDDDVQIVDDFVNELLVGYTPSRNCDLILTSEEDDVDTEEEKERMDTRQKKREEKAALAAASAAASSGTAPMET